jgi:hypothetical protein
MFAGVEGAMAPQCMEVVGQWVVDRIDVGAAQHLVVWPEIVALPAGCIDHDLAGLIERRP